MALVVPNSAEIIMLRYILGLTTPGNKILRLYTNSTPPSDSTVLGSLTEPDGASGYNVHTLYGSSWTVAQDGAGVTTALYTELAFNFTTGATIYGYWVTSTTSDLCWVEQFNGAPYQLPVTGGQISVQARATLD